MLPAGFILGSNVGPAFYCLVGPVDVNPQHQQKHHQRPRQKSQSSGDVRTWQLVASMLNILSQSVEVWPGQKQLLTTLKQGLVTSLFQSWRFAHLD